jgi:hypothetical protein
MLSHIARPSVGRNEEEEEGVGGGGRCLTTLFFPKGEKKQKIVSLSGI